MPLINKRWDGNRFRTGATFRRWTGSAWKSGATVRTWNGSDWVPSLFKLIGGDVVYKYGQYTIHAFKNTANFIVSGKSDVEYIIIGGGGAGAGPVGGGHGGGAGAYLFGSGKLTPGTHTANIGRGGTYISSGTYAGQSLGGIDSWLSCFPSMRAAGGGGGLSRNGGSGAGCSREFGTGRETPAGIKIGLGQGFGGGASLPGGLIGGSGGGGAGGSPLPGQDYDGGPGIIMPWYSGSPNGAISQYMAGGGAGGTSNGRTSPGGSGVGGNSNSDMFSGAAATAGMPNTGSGGGGSNYQLSGVNTIPGSGGSGIILIRYITPL